MLWKPPRYLAGLWVGVSLVTYPLVYVLVYMATGHYPKGGLFSGGRFVGLADVIRDLQRAAFQATGSRHE